MKKSKHQMAVATNGEGDYFIACKPPLDSTQLQFLSGRVIGISNQSFDSEFALYPIAANSKKESMQVIRQVAGLLPASSVVEICGGLRPMADGRDPFADYNYAPRQDLLTPLYTAAID